MSSPESIKDREIQSGIVMPKLAPEDNRFGVLPPQEVAFRPGANFLL